jgi:N-acetylglucosamine malate deacetylase 1
VNYVMNTYLEFVAGFSQLIRDGRRLPLGGITAPVRPALPAGAPRAMIFSPHPDDECIFGGLALRLMRESGFRVINVAVTQGSNKERQQPRLQELRHACAYLGFDLEQTAPNGLEKISPKTRAQDPVHWAKAVQRIAACLTRHQPSVIFFPHDSDYNGTHIGTHFLVMDALKLLAPDFECRLIETEFWAPMASPNLMVELGAPEAADLITALSFHVGEVQRNPYHLSMPAWLQDNVRRGAEVVGGQGGAAPDFLFATLYRLRHWKDGRGNEAFAGGKILTGKESPSSVLGPIRAGADRP